MAHQKKNNHAPRRGSGRERVGAFMTDTIAIAGHGVGFLKADDQEIRIGREDLGGALHGDYVKARLTKDRDGAIRHAEVVEVLTRVKTEFVGTLRKEKRAYFVEPQDGRCYTDIAVFERDAARHKARPGDKILVKITVWSDPARLPLGEIVKRIGVAGQHEAEMQSLMIERGVRPNFPKGVEREAEEIRKNAQGLFEEELSKRRDMRGVPTFTIDPHDAKDFDDALSIRLLPDGFEIGVHIADVSFYMREGTPLDREAARRGTSVYLVDRTIPMLPEVLSNDLCSLNPNEDKLTFSAVFEMNGQGEIRSRWFGRTIIRSDKRFTYEEAQETLDRGNGLFFDELKTLERLAKLFRAERFARGALSFEHDEVRIELDRRGIPVRIYKKPRWETNRLIEDFMLLANNEVAKYVSDLDPEIERTFVYRVHDLPNADKVAELTRLVRALGYDLSAVHEATPVETIKEILKQIEGTTHADILRLGIIQTMAKAIYSTKNIGHFGLSLKHYTHFTSPIRRYPDVLVHRLLETYLSGKKVPQRALEEYEAMSRYATQAEIAAQDAERASIKYKQAEYLSRKKHETFAAVISGVTERGFFVRTTEAFAEGMVKLRDIDDDYYVFDENRFAVVGEKTKKQYAIGDAIRVNIIRISPERGQIDFTLVKEPKR